MYTLALGLTVSDTPVCSDTLKYILVYWHMGMTEKHCSLASLATTTRSIIQFKNWEYKFYRKSSRTFCPFISGLFVWLTRHSIDWWGNHWIICLEYGRKHLWSQGNHKRQLSLLSLSFSKASPKHKLIALQPEPTCCVWSSVISRGLQVLRCAPCCSGFRTTLLSLSHNLF